MAPDEWYQSAWSSIHRPPKHRNTNPISELNGQLRQARAGCVARGVRPNPSGARRGVGSLGWVVDESGELQIRIHDVSMKTGAADEDDFVLRFLLEQHGRTTIRSFLRNHTESTTAELLPTIPVLFVLGNFSKRLRQEMRDRLTRDLSRILSGDLLADDVFAGGLGCAGDMDRRLSARYFQRKRVAETELKEWLR